MRNQEKQIKANPTKQPKHPKHIYVCERRSIIKFHWKYIQKCCYSGIKNKCDISTIKPHLEIK